jgi:hypothetical protein
VVDLGAESFGLGADDAGLGVGIKKTLFTSNRRYTFKDKIKDKIKIKTVIDLRAAPRRHRVVRRQRPATALKHGAMAQAAFAARAGDLSSVRASCRPLPSLWRGTGGTRLASRDCARTLARSVQRRITPFAPVRSAAPAFRSQTFALSRQRPRQARRTSAAEGRHDSLSLRVQAPVRPPRNGLSEPFVSARLSSRNVTRGGSHRSES